jgi:ferredoxin
MAHKPLGLEGMDIRLVEYMEAKELNVEHLQYLPDGDGWLMVEFGGDTEEEAEARARAALGASAPPRRPSWTHGSIQTTPSRATSGTSGSRAGRHRLRPGPAPTWEGWEDAAVAPEHIGELPPGLPRPPRPLRLRLRPLRPLRPGLRPLPHQLRLHDPGGDRPLPGLHRRGRRPGPPKYGGSLSGEHGDGQSRGALLPKMFGDELMEAFREFKRIWDPDWMMNPGKVIDAYPPDEQPLHGARLQARRGGDPLPVPRGRLAFHSAVTRCVGVGKCRRTDGGTMCPSYMVTREEKHSTRGRARLLYEMMRGETITDGWKSEEVKEALDLCLSCKGCKGDCPVDVDMATYKAEFLSHYYEGRLRPRPPTPSASSTGGHASPSSRPGSSTPSPRRPSWAPLLKKAGGVHRRGTIPTFATQTFRQWFAERGPSTVDGRRVIIWPDTFNNFFRPDVGRAAVEVLEGAGFRPVLPEAMLCCGRPLYDFGMLTLAKRQLRQILDELRDEIRAGTLIVGLEPSCVATFRGELIELFPTTRTPTASPPDVPAHRVPRPSTPRRRPGQPGRRGGPRPRPLPPQVGPRLRPPSAPSSTASDRLPGPGLRLLRHGRPLRLRARTTTTCPRRAASASSSPPSASRPRTLVITSGFSCREMIEQNGFPRPLHTAEVLHMAMQRRGMLPTLGSSVSPGTSCRGTGVRKAPGQRWRGGGRGGGVPHLRIGRSLLRRVGIAPDGENDREYVPARPMPRPKANCTLIHGKRKIAMRVGASWRGARGAGGIHPPHLRDG